MLVRGRLARLARCRLHSPAQRGRRSESSHAKAFPVRPGARWSPRLRTPSVDEHLLRRDDGVDKCSDVHLPSAVGEGFGPSLLHRGRVGRMDSRVGDIERKGNGFWSDQGGSSSSGVVPSPGNRPGTRPIGQVPPFTYWFKADRASGENADPCVTKPYGPRHLARAIAGIFCPHFQCKTPFTSSNPLDMRR